MRLLVEKVIVSPRDMEVRLRGNGIEALAIDLPPDLTLFELAVDPPELWEEQRRRIDGMMLRLRIESCR